MKTIEIIFAILGCGIFVAMGIAMLILDIKEDYNDRTRYY